MDHILTGFTEFLYLVAFAVDRTITMRYWYSLEKSQFFGKPMVSAKRKRGCEFGPRSRFALTIQIDKLYHYVQ